MNGGKWRYLMDATPRRLPVFEDVNAILSDTAITLISLTPACRYSSATDGTRTIQMLGHSMNAVSLPKDGALSFEFEVDKDGDYTISTMLIPTHPNDNGDLRYCVAVDDALPVTFSLKEPFRSERWKENVLNGQANRHLRQRLQAGRHRLVIRAVDSHIVVDQWSLKRIAD